MKMMPYTHHQRIVEFGDLKDLLDIETADKQESSVVESGVTKQDTTRNIPSDDCLLLEFLNRDEVCVPDAESSTEGPSRTFKSEKPKKNKKKKKMGKKRCRLEFLVEACRFVMELENNEVVGDASDMKSSVISK